MHSSWLRTGEAVAQAVTREESIHAKRRERIARTALVRHVAPHGPQTACVAAALLSHLASGLTSRLPAGVLPGPLLSLTRSPPGMQLSVFHQGTRPWNLASISVVSRKMSTSCGLHASLWHARRSTQLLPGTHCSAPSARVLHQGCGASPSGMGPACSNQDQQNSLVATIRCRPALIG